MSPVLKNLLSMFRPAQVNTGSSRLSAVNPPVQPQPQPLLQRPDNTAVGLVVDCETTGLGTSDDELIELGLVQFWFDPNTFKVVGISDTYRGLREPSRPIPPEATRVHGLRDSDVRGACLSKERVATLVDSAGLLISHNAAFDKPFVQRLFPQVGSKTWLCSLRGINWGRLGHRSSSLQELAADLSLKSTSAHRALDDALLLLEILRRETAEGIPFLKVLVEGSVVVSTSSTPLRSPARNADRKLLAAELPRLQSTKGLVERHFLYLNLLGAAYRLRKEDPQFRASFEELARAHIREFDQIAPQLKREFHGSLPSVPTFEQLSIVLVEDGRFDDAVAVCEAAIHFGLDETSGAYEARIERIRRKQGRPSAPNMQPPPCPYCQTKLKTVPTRKTKCPSCARPIFFWRRQEFFPSPYLTEDQDKALPTLIDLKRFGIGVSDFVAEQEQLEQRFGSRPGVLDVVWRLFQESLRRNATDGAVLAYLYDRMAEFRLAEGADPFELRSNARHWQLENLRRRGFQAVVIKPSGDCCAACAEVAGRRVLIADAISGALLPVRHCSTINHGHPNCRCSYDLPNEPIVIRI